MLRGFARKQGRTIGLTVAYFLHAFPTLSETFVLNEILQLKKHGINVYIYSLHRFDEGIVHGEAVPLINDTTYVSDIGKKAKLRSLVHLFLTHPLRLFKTAWFVRGKHDKNLNWSMKQAIYLASEVSGVGVRHIHAHFSLEATEHAMLVGMLTGKPYSFTAHAVDIYVHQRMLRDKMNYANFIVTVCAYNKDYLLGYNQGFPEKRVHVIRVGIDPDAFPGDEKAAGRERLDGCVHIVSVARLVEKKGLKYLIEGLHGLRQAGLKFRATILGEGPERRSLMDLIDRYQIVSAVHLVGAKEARQVKALLREADVFVLPCIIGENGDRDATPTSLIEAMAMGVPVISTTVAGIPEVVPESGGILVPPKDTVALTEAIKAIYRMGRAGRSEMGKRGREYVLENCNLESETQKLVELFVTANKSTC